MIKESASEFRNTSKETSELFNTILGMAAWQFKQQYSWVVQGYKQFSLMNLYYCVDDVGVKGFKAYKASRSTLNCLQLDGPRDLKITWSRVWLYPITNAILPL